MQIYVLMPETTDFPYVFVNREDAEAFALARWPEDVPNIEEQSIIDHALAQQMLAEESEDYLTPRTIEVARIAAKYVR